VQNEVHYLTVSLLANMTVSFMGKQYLLSYNSKQSPFLDSELSPRTNQECYHSSLHPKASHNLDVLTACDLLNVTTLGDRFHTQQAAHNPSALQQSETKDNKWDDFTTGTHISV